MGLEKKEFLTKAFLFIGLMNLIELGMPRFIEYNDEWADPETEGCSANEFQAIFYTLFGIGKQRALQNIKLEKYPLNTAAYR